MRVFIFTYQKWFIAYFCLHIETHVQISSWCENIKKFHAHFGRHIWYRYTSRWWIFRRKCILVNEIVIVHHHIHFDLKFVRIVCEICANWNWDFRKFHFLPLTSDSNRRNTHVSVWNWTAEYSCRHNSHNSNQHMRMVHVVRVHVAAARLCSNRKIQGWNSDSNRLTEERRSLIGFSNDFYVYENLIGQLNEIKWTLIETIKFNHWPCTYTRSGCKCSAPRWQSHKFWKQSSSSFEIDIPTYFVQQLPFNN